MASPQDANGIPTGYDRSVFLRHRFTHMLYFMGCGKVPTIITKKAARVECENGRKLLSFPVLCDPETPSP